MVSVNFRERLAGVLASLLLAWGIFELWGWRTGPQHPAWAPGLRPLHQAPWVAGETVGVVFPPALEVEARQRVLMELAWQFPQVRWLPLAEVHSGLSWVLLAPGVSWQGPAVWQGGGWTLVHLEGSP